MKNVIKLICVGVVLFGLSACGEKDSKDLAQTSSAESSSKSSSKKVPVIVLEQELGVSTSADLGKIGCKITNGEPYKNNNIPNPPKDWIKYSIGEASVGACQQLEELGFNNAFFTYENDKLVKMHWVNAARDKRGGLLKPMGKQARFDVFNKFSQLLGEKYNEVNKGDRFVLYDNGSDALVHLSINQYGVYAIIYVLKSFEQKEIDLENEFKQQKDSELKSRL